MFMSIYTSLLRIFLSSTQRYRYEDWGLEFDFFKYPVTVTNVKYGSIADEYPATIGRGKDIQIGDVLVEINGQPICPSKQLVNLINREKDKGTKREDWLQNAGAMGSMMDGGMGDESGILSTGSKYCAYKILNKRDDSEYCNSIQEYYTVYTGRNESLFHIRSSSRPTMDFCTIQVYYKSEF
jgi:hypothetical protein